MINIKEIKQNLEDNGWVLFDYPNNDEVLLQISSKIGKIINHPNGKLIDYLTPKNKAEAKKDTFSNKYGFDRFPFHTDTAFWTTPVRYVLMSCQNNSLTETLIITLESLNNLNSEEISILENSIFLIKTNRVNFYCSILSKQNGNLILRFDPNTMKAINSYAKKAITIIEKIVTNSEIHRIKWSDSGILIIDNWRTLHSRSSVYSNENRILKRIYIS
ncbi:hypothetical protein MODO_3431 [Myroides odoratimimus]|uniref:TauD/TfdA family dioxygenase n=1 Tax=Myroides odoratimimus TaxID=76832 RepID=UPI0007277CC9|nr:TauD/TfdA family dioxygenase [Myroides odoratimimus]GAQ15726.1 hypothetical protein MODO_3431 [Myroides odoratimimus]STZ47775.1 Taurine catabolism dioxygenase TauD, TfdA family [Myroides odoratimimus]